MEIGSGRAQTLRCAAGRQHSGRSDSLRGGGRSEGEDRGPGARIRLLHATHNKAGRERRGRQPVWLPHTGGLQRWCRPLNRQWRGWCDGLAPPLTSPRRLRLAMRCAEPPLRLSASVRNARTARAISTKFQSLALIAPRSVCSSPPQPLVRFRRRSSVSCCACVDWAGTPTSTSALWLLEWLWLWRRLSPPRQSNPDAMQRHLSDCKRSMPRPPAPAVGSQPCCAPLLQRTHTRL